MFILLPVEIVARNFKDLHRHSALNILLRNTIKRKHVYDHTEFHMPVSVVR
jgi:hypothetical protein